MGARERFEHQIFANSVAANIHLCTCHFICMSIDKAKLLRNVHDSVKFILNILKTRNLRLSLFEI